MYECDFVHGARSLLRYMRGSPIVLSWQTLRVVNSPDESIAADVNRTVQPCALPHHKNHHWRKKDMFSVYLEILMHDTPLVQ